MTNPRLLTIPFADTGTKNEIPVSGAIEPQLATFQAGFPVVTQQKISEGGIPPERADFNGILNIYGQHIVHLNKGMPYEFDQDFANAIGGYPLHARIMLSDGQIAQNTIDGNTSNPNLAGTGWLIGISASLVKNANGETQQKINDYIGVNWYAKAGGYALNDRVRLLTGEIVQSTVNANTNNPNVDMTGWSNKVGDASQIFDEGGKSQQEINDKVLSFSVSSIAELPSSAAANAVAYIQDLDANYIFKSGIWKPYVQVSASLNAFPKLAPELGDDGRFLRAKESLQRQSIAGLSGLSCYTETVIEIPSGIYNINSEINLSTVAHVKSEGQAIIRQSDPTKDIFVLSNFYLTKIEGIKFFGGRRHISFSNANFDATLVKIYDCEFWESSDYAIYSIGTVAPTYHMSCHAVMRDCKFISCKKIAYNSCDKMEFYGGWVHLDYRNFDANSAAFMVARGSLEMHGVLGVPYLGDTSASLRWKANVRWVDNYGIFKANGTRFGGEDGGIPIVYNYSGYRADEPLMGGIVSLTGCQANCGILANRSDAGVVRLMTKVPFLLEIKGCNYILGAPYVSVDPTFDLTAYFAAVTNPQLRYKVRIDGNMTAFGGITKTIPDQLIPFTRGDVIAEPIAAPKLVSKTSLDSNRAQFVFEMNNTTVAQEFFITVSGSQNVSGSALYRDFSTYLAATFIGYGSSSIIKELAYTPLPKPTVTKITAPTTKVEIESLFWGEGTTGNVEQDAVSTNKRFSVVVKNCSGNVNTTSVTINLLQQTNVNPFGGFFIFR